MISVFKKGTPQIVGGLGDGTRTSPWYWYGKTSGQTVAVNNSNASSGDRYRVYLRVKLKGGTTYTIGQTSIGGDGDGMIWLYNSAMSEVASDDHSGGEINGLEVQDVFDYTPSADGVYIIGAGAYSEDTGNFTVAISPAPEQETLPEIEYQYPTSSGFNSLGRPLKFRNAKEAGCEISRIPEEGLVFYAPLDKEASTAVTGQTLSKSGTITYEEVDGVPMTSFDSGGYFQIDDETIPTGNSDRTLSLWIKQFNVNNSGVSRILQMGNGITNCLSIDVVKSANSCGVDNWNNNTYIGWCPISDNINELQHIAVTYSGSSRQWIGYTNSEVFGSIILNDVLDTSNRIYIGRVDNMYYYGAVAAVRVYNRVLSPAEIRALSKEFNV